MNDGNLSPAARATTRGVCRHLVDRGYAPVTEVTLATGRRVDVMALAPDGSLLVVEVKSCAADYLSDGKWEEYLEYCDAFTFAVPPDFPLDLLPAAEGLIVADAHEAAVLRPPAPRPKLHASRRKAVTHLFATTAACRLRLLLDPPMARVLAEG
ncbi:MmcB family DNA repair protein [Caenispirillum bisanense]|uniref:DNA repair protein MmcB-related protein n=1 Tax=Caenispirillum bisanense TaxID=414052 RepID=A0A286G8Q8_9PROT|nr:MmcB family DNA repair protein [Caenispirillum bisanense]SOD91957.1 hypothetical protein SAMN05421508_102193 [Caenispirillum bisanense]